MLNLDTHMVVALLQGDLRPAEELLVLREEWAISDIVLWELAKLIQLGRLEMDFEEEGFGEFLRIVTIFPISAEVARQSTRLDFVSSGRRDHCRDQPRRANPSTDPRWEDAGIKDDSPGTNESLIGEAEPDGPPTKPA